MGEKKEGEARGEGGRWTTEGREREVGGRGTP